MMWWSPTARREAVDGLATLLRRQEWSAAEGGPLRSALRPFLDGPDEVCRWFTVGVIHLLARDPVTALGLIRSRLGEEPVFEVGGALTRQLGRFVGDYPALVDEALHEAAFAPWLRAHDDQDPQIDLLFADAFVGLALHMALIEKTPRARALTESWFQGPSTSAVCDRAITLIRHYLVHPGADERARAFGLIQLAADAAENTRTASDLDSPEFRKARSVAEAVVTAVCLAGSPEPENEPRRLPSGFCAHALDVFGRVSAFRNEDMVHDIVRTLDRLAPEDPSAVLLSLREVIDKGDPRSASFHFLDKEATTNLCARYLSEFWEDIGGEEQHLTALRRILVALVQAGWPSAIELSQRLGDAFR